MSTSPKDLLNNLLNYHLGRIRTKSRIRIRIRIKRKVGAGSGSASNKNHDPDPHQGDADPQHCLNYFLEHGGVNNYIKSLVPHFFALTWYIWRRTGSNIKIYRQFLGKYSRRMHPTSLHIKNFAANKYNKKWRGGSMFGSHLCCASFTNLDCVEVHFLDKTMLV